ncbi:MAG TPA: hypothetical protein VFF20_08520 [Pseudogracilibacillus sp.]|nr:hypothetical protein [Pseudogracilibacillus sp.]
MGKENERNQADNLMKLFQEVANHTPEDDNEEVDSNDLDKEVEEVKEEAEVYVELDMLNLPPRREVHGKSKSRFSFTLNNPVNRLVFIVLIIVIIFAVLIYFDVIKEPFSLF